MALALPTATPSRLRLIVGVSCYTVSLAVCQAAGYGPKPLSDHFAYFYATLGFVLGMFSLIYVPMTQDVRPARYIGLYLLILALLVWMRPGLSTPDAFANLSVITSAAAAAFAARYTEKGSKMWTPRH
ncbi:hypothetical protein ABZ543_12735 [Streptomyces roseifaciens]